MKEHPETHKSIIERLKDIGANKNAITALNLLKVVNGFNRYRGIENPLWHQNTDLRRELVAVMLLYFCPEKMYGLLEENTRSRLTKELTHITGCVHQSISRDMSIVLSWFKIYTEFRTTIIDITNFVNKS